MVIVPESALGKMWLTVEKHPDVKLAILQGDADYSDAIELAGKIASLEGYFPEGGAKNVARRDGMGTVVLSAVEEIGRMPDHYFQAIGSGTGAIAAWEMSRRLLLDGSHGSKPLKLHLVQNEPYALITDAWRSGARDLARMDEQEAKVRIRCLHSASLTNRNPPYALPGGVYDALRESGGQTYAVTSEEALLAGWLFESLEGCDLDPAAEVAVAGLVRAARQRRIGSGDLILLNLTGGRRKRLELDLPIRFVQPDYVFSSEGLNSIELERQLRRTPATTPA